MRYPASVSPVQHQDDSGCGVSRFAVHAISQRPRPRCGMCAGCVVGRRYGGAAPPLPARCVCHTLSAMTQPTVLISGAGVAGPALAHWLSGNGYRVVIVETGTWHPARRADRRPARRRRATSSSGWACSIRWSTARCDQRGIAWVRADGSRRAEMPVEAFDGNGVVSKLEILRGDLVDVLYQATKDAVEYRFDTRIAAARPDRRRRRGHAVRRDAPCTRTSSWAPTDRTRRCGGSAFGPEEQFVKPLGGYNAWFTAPDTAGLDGWYLMYQAPGGLNASLRPSHDPAIAKAGLGIPLGAADLRPPRSRRAATTARRSIRRRRLAFRRTVGRRRARPTTSTSTRSPRFTWTRGRGAA